MPQGKVLSTRNSKYVRVNKSGNYVTRSRSTIERRTIEEIHASQAEASAYRKAAAKVAFENKKAK